MAYSHHRVRSLLHNQMDEVAGEDSPGPQIPFKDQTLSVTHSSEIMEPSDLRPFPKPEVALLEALQYLADNDWYVSQSLIFFFLLLSSSLGWKRKSPVEHN